MDSTTIANKRTRNEDGSIVEQRLDRSDVIFAAHLDDELAQLRNLRVLELAERARLRLELELAAQL